MGRAVCTAVTLDPDLELVTTVAPRSVGESRHGVTIRRPDINASRAQAPGSGAPKLTSAFFCGFLILKAR